MKLILFTNACVVCKIKSLNLSDDVMLMVKPRKKSKKCWLDT